MVRTSNQKQRKCGSTAFINTDNLCQLKLFVWLQSWDLPNSFSFQLIYYHSIILSSLPEAGQNAARTENLEKIISFSKIKLKAFFMCEKDQIPEDYSCTLSKCCQNPLCLIALDNHYCLITGHWKFKAEKILLWRWLKRQRKKTKNQSWIKSLHSFRDQPNLAWVLLSQVTEAKLSLYFPLLLHATQFLVELW